MERVEEGLEAYLERTGANDWETFADAILLPLLSDLALGHSRGIVHRDIKPANILVTDLCTPMLADFGIAKLIASTRLGVTVRPNGPLAGGILDITRVTPLPISLLESYRDR